MAYVRGVKLNQGAQHSSFKGFLFPCWCGNSPLHAFQFGLCNRPSNHPLCPDTLTALTRHSSLSCLPMCHQGALNEPTALHGISHVFIKNMKIWASIATVHPSRIYYSLSCSQGPGGNAGVCHSCLRAKTRFHPGQVGSSSLGHVERQTTTRTDTQSHRQLRVPSSPHVHVPLACGRWPENPDRTHADTVGWGWESCKLHPERVRAQGSNPQPSCFERWHQSTLQLICHRC